MIADGRDGRGARDGRARPATGKPTAEWELVSWSRPSSGILLGLTSLRARYELPPLPNPLPPLSSPGSRLLHLCTYILTCGHVLLLHPIDLAIPFLVVLYAHRHTLSPRPTLPFPSILLSRIPTRSFRGAPPPPLPGSCDHSLFHDHHDFLEDLPLPARRLRPRLVCVPVLCGRRPTMGSPQGRHHLLDLEK